MIHKNRNTENNFGCRSWPRTSVSRFRVSRPIALDDPAILVRKVRFELTIKRVLSAPRIPAPPLPQSFYNLVGPERVELSCPKAAVFETAASTSFITGRNLSSRSASSTISMSACYFAPTLFAFSRSRSALFVIAIMVTIISICTMNKNFSQWRMMSFRMASLTPNYTLSDFGVTSFFGPRSNLVIYFFIWIIGDPVRRILSSRNLNTLLLFAGARKPRLRDF